MPASMMSENSGFSAKVAGSSMAMVATGPMPGNTPIKVPRKQPMRQYISASGCMATLKPSAKFENNASIGFS